MALTARKPGTSRIVEGLIGRLPPPDVPVSGFGPRQVADQELRAIVAAARVAPSADNHQTWRYLTVTSPAKKVALAAAVPPALAGNVKNAPVVAVVCGVRGIVKSTKREQPFVLIDVPISIVHALFQAVEIGLECSWTLNCEEGTVRKQLSIPDDVRVVGLLNLGWPG